MPKDQTASTPEKNCIEKKFALKEPNRIRFTYSEQISIESVTQSVSNLAMQFGEGEEDNMVSST